MTLHEAYQTLELNNRASDEEVKQQYRKLAKKYHPDVNKNDKDAETKFKKISEAYAVITNKTPTSNGPNLNDFGFDFSEILRGHFNFDFGFRQRPQQPQDKRSAFISQLKKEIPEQNINVVITVPVDGIIARTPILLENVSKITNCSTCNGLGINLATEHACKFCGGSGNITKQEGVYFSSSTCYACKGTGIVFDKCPQCNQNGHVQEASKISLNLNTQVALKTLYKIPNYGIPSKNKTPEKIGDLLVNIDVIPNEHVAVVNGFLTNTIPIIVSASDIINKNKIEIPTWNYETKQYEKVKVNLPEEVGFSSSPVMVNTTDLSFSYALDDYGLMNDYGARTKYLVRAVLDAVIK
jgi:molecular chaperone DnaJ